VKPARLLETPKGFLQRLVNLVFGQQVLEGVVAGDDRIEPGRANGKSPPVRDKTGQSNSATYGLVTGALHCDGRDIRARNLESNRCEAEGLCPDADGGVEHSVRPRTQFAGEERRQRLSLPRDGDLSVLVHQVVPGREGVVETSHVQDRHTVSVRIFLSEPVVETQNRSRSVLRRSRRCRAGPGSTLGLASAGSPWASCSSKRQRHDERRGLLDARVFLSTRG
jgi:hypothetical protein